MRVTRNSWWLTLTQSIIGFDDGAEGGSGAGTGEGEPGAGQGDPGNAGGDDAGKEDVSGLKSALEKERADRKKLEKDLAAFQRKQKAAEDAEKTEVERLKGENELVNSKTAKLAAGFKQNALETAILKAAGAAKFRDPSDALRAEVIAAIGVDQDEDDPSKVTIDAATVTQAIKDLAKAKPHYIAGPEKTTVKSGSNFGGGTTTPKGDEALAELKRKFPALRGL